jgi:hypothetical protein
MDNSREIHKQMVSRTKMDPNKVPLVYNDKTNPYNSHTCAISINQKHGVLYISRVYYYNGNFSGEEILPDDSFANAMRPEDIDRLEFELVHENKLIEWRK